MKPIAKFLLVLAFALLLINFLLRILPNINYNFNNETGIRAFIIVAILLSMLYGAFRSPNPYTKIKQLAVWTGIILVIITGYAFRFELNYASRRVLAAIIPNYNWTDQEGQIVIGRSRDGHFYINALVNNSQKILFMVDTGASDVALSQEAAKKLNIDLSKLQYIRRYGTANGESLAAPIKITSLQIGNQVFNDVEAHVGRGELDVSLLGMSALQRFKSFRIEKDLLILKN